MSPTKSLLILVMFLQSQETWSLALSAASESSVAQHFTGILKMNDLKVSCSSCKILVKAKGAGIYGLFLLLGFHQTLPVSPNARFPLKELSRFIFCCTSCLPQAQNCDFHWLISFAGCGVVCCTKKIKNQRKFKMQSFQETENRLNRQIWCNTWGEKSPPPTAWGQRKTTGLQILRCKHDHFKWKANNVKTGLAPLT